jgi:hypothetical protein
MANHSSHSRTLARRALIFVGTLVLASAGRESIGDELANSNVLGTFTGPTWATVTVVQVGTGPGVVKFTVTPNNNTGVYVQPLGANFGVTKFTFNTSSGFTIVAGDIAISSPSAGCNKVQNPSGDPFGSFNWEITSKIGANPLIFTVTQTGATPSSFEYPNANKAMFSAEIGGFTVKESTVTSQWVSESGTVYTAVRAPIVAAEILLVIAGLVAILLVLGIVFVKRKKGAAPASS